MVLILSLNMSKHLHNLSDSSSMRKKPLNVPSNTYSSNKAKHKDIRHQRVLHVINNNMTLEFSTRNSSSSIINNKIFVLSKQSRRSINNTKTVHLRSFPLNKQQPLHGCHQAKNPYSSVIHSSIQPQRRAMMYTLGQK